MVDLSVQPADSPGQSGIARRETRPDLSADAAAHPFMIEVIVVGSRGRRMDAAAEVALEVSIFAGIVGDFGEERLRQIVRIKIEPDFFQYVEPENLKLQIVVRLRDPPEFRLEPVVESLFAPFQRRTDRTAHALSQPTAVDLVEISLIIHESSAFRC